MNPQLVPLGDAALVIRFGDQIDPAVNRQVHALDGQLRAHGLAGVIETAPAYASVIVHYDPLLLTLAEVSDWVRAGISLIEARPTPTPARIEVPVHYGGEDGPDLKAVADLHHMDAETVVRLHTRREYTVYMMGFTPGFPYMGMLDDAIAAPRLATPRTRVPAGSVGIAGRQTGIYPIDSPGGWQIIGRTSLRLFDLESEPPFRLSPGDVVRFVVEALDV